MHACMHASIYLCMLVGAGSLVLAYLIPPSAIQMPRLKKPGKAGIPPIHPRALILAEQVLPIGRSPLEPFRIARPIHPARDLRNRKVIIRILQRARDTAGHGPEAHGIKVLDGDIVPGLPAIQPAAAFGGPVEGLFVGVFLHGGVAGFPVDAVGYVLDVCVCENDIGVGAALSVACKVLLSLLLSLCVHGYECCAGRTFTQRHAAVREPA